MYLKNGMVASTRNGTDTFPPVLSTPRLHTAAGDRRHMYSVHVRASPNKGPFHAEDSLVRCMLYAHPPGACQSTTIRSKAGLDPQGYQARQAQVEKTKASHHTRYPLMAETRSTQGAGPQQHHAMGSLLLSIFRFPRRSELTIPSASA